MNIPLLITYLLLVRVTHTTRLSAIRYSLSRQLKAETERKKILAHGSFEDGHTLDKDIRDICGDLKSCTLSFIPSPSP